MNLIKSDGFRCPIFMADGKVRNLESFRNAKRKQRGMEWKFLGGCFDYGIMPTDIDGVIERNGRYLFFEEKTPGIELETGQYRLFNDLNKQWGATIFIVWGNTEIPYVKELEIWRPFGKCNKHGEGRERIQADIDLLRTKCNAWFRWVDK